MAKQPLVSVIITCFNLGQYLAEAVDSVLAQTYPEYEILIVDDGSTAKQTKKILKNFVRPKTKIIHTKNCGLAAARHKGIALAHGKYILPLDADDKIAPTYMAKAIKILEKNPQVGIVYAEAEFFGRRHGKWDLADYKFPDILLSNSIFCSAFFRKKDWTASGGYNERLIYGYEDHDFWLSLIELGCRVQRIPEILFFYRQRKDSMFRRSTFRIKSLPYSLTEIFQRHRGLYAKSLDFIYQKYIELYCSSLQLGSGYAKINRERRFYKALLIVLAVSAIVWAVKIMSGR